MKSVPPERRKTLIIHGTPFRADMLRKGWDVVYAGVAGHKGDDSSWEYILTGQHNSRVLNVFCGHDNKAPRFELRHSKWEDRKQSIELDRIPDTLSAKSICRETD